MIRGGKDMPFREATVNSFIVKPLSGDTSLDNLPDVVAGGKRRGGERMNRMVALKQVKSSAVDQTEPAFGVTRYLDYSHRGDCTKTGS